LYWKTPIALRKVSHDSKRWSRYPRQYRAGLKW
jgi:hypothetical protein